MDDFDFEKNSEIKNETSEGETSAPEQAEPIREEPQFTAPEVPQTPTQPYVPPVQNTGYPYGQGATPNTGYPYSPMQNGYGTPPYGNQPYYTNANNYPPVTPRPAPPKPKKSKGGKAVLTIVIIGIVVCAIAFAINFAKSHNEIKNSLTVTDSRQEERTSDSVTVPINDIDDEGNLSTAPSQGAMSATEIYEKICDVSVGVLVYQKTASSNFTTNLVGEGSGVIVAENSAHTGTYIITCAHVVSDAGITVKVQLTDGEQYSADIVGIDNKTDIAVLLVNKTGLKAAQFGSSKLLKVGQTVYAIGNPGGTEFFGSFTSGIISAIARPVNSPVGYEMNCIQHDAAINPGNSGGALVNEYGQVIGINSSKIAASAYEGMGFAVPSETVKEIADEIIAHGYVTDRAKLGINYATVSQSQAYSMIVQINKYPAGSIIISSINSDSSLKNTKAQEGDLIIKANGKELTTSDVLFELIQNGHIGDKITLTLVRIGSNYETTEFDVDAVLVEDKGTTDEEPATEGEYYNPFDFGN